MSGVLGLEYHRGRERRVDFAYRLSRRGLEVEGVIGRFLGGRPGLDCLDVGTADGLMLSRLNSRFRFRRAVGIDLSEELIKVNRDRNIELLAMSAEDLRFEAGSFDVVVAAAVIEHLEYPGRMVSECYRVLRDGGIFVVTAPNPLYEGFSAKTGYIKGGQHVGSFTLGGIEGILRGSGFKIVYSKYFMFFPFFRIPLEESVESVLRRAGLGGLMTNQLVVGRK